MPDLVITVTDEQEETLLDIGRVLDALGWPTGDTDQSDEVAAIILISMVDRLGSVNRPMSTALIRRLAEII